MSDWDDWTKQANDDDLFDYSIQSEKNIPKRPSGGGGCGSGCLMAVIAVVGLIALVAILLV